MNNPYHLIPVLDFDKEIMVRASGSYCYDSDGKEYLDLNSGQFCAILGHNNEEVNRILHAQLDRLQHTSTSMISDRTVEAAEKIYRISGDMKGYSILLSTGAEAVEFCLRQAKFLKKRDGIVCFDKGYHGLTLGAQSVTFGGRYAIPNIHDIYAISVPKMLQEEDLVLQQLEGILIQSSEKIAAAVFEPIVSVGGMFYPSEKFFTSVREMCAKYDVLLILDESQTGMGRTGKWFCFQNWASVTPDMLVLAKGVGNGMPVSVAVFNEKIIPAAGLMPASHYSSHQNDPFGACVISAVIDYIEKYNLLQRVTKTGDLMLARLQDFCRNNPFLVCPRGKGLMLGAELHKEGVVNYRSVYKDLHQAMMDRGVIIQATNGGQTLRFLPDYLLTERDITKAFSSLDSALKQLDWDKYVR